MADKKTAEKKITKNMLIGQVVDEYPDAIGTLVEAGMHCMGCGAAHMETIEDGLKAHGMGKKEIDSIIEKMNKAVKKR